MSHPVTSPSVRTGSVTSTDGTVIGFRQLGDGPGIVLLHGSMSSGYNHLQLAELLADAFTVYLPDRRGRGLSGPYQSDDGLDTEVDDLAALLDHAEVQCVFGVSSGGIVCLEAARQLRTVRKAVIFEPPLFPDRAPAERILNQFDERMACGDVAGAMAIAMKGAQMGPAFLRRLPDRLLGRLTAMAMKGEARRPPGGYVSMGTLAPTLHHDFRIVVEASGQPDRFAGLSADVLLMGGSKSPRYLKDALTVVERTLPQARRVELPGLDHAASWNSDRGGRPGPVAKELRRFLG